MTQLWKYADLLWSLAILAAGLIITFFSASIVLFVPSWIYQLFIGSVLIAAGGFTGVIAWMESTPTPVLIRDEWYGFLGGFMLVVGVVVFMNFHRYDDVQRLAGTWPVIVLGALTVFAGLISLIHHLTVFERRLNQDVSKRLSTAAA